ncbi:DNA topoisomerase III [Pseudorhodoferax soli]|uniref:DNA topoisomerase n=1 Tax=Pseudorhodoferax soli TaxID=545864 RepID=A0A368XCP3_9BURK|nr:DNA topoisomerase III [Pseudorhodoferax soli]RCW65710.1 DNA topoisomerase-3 [Pseudorhodoferax soli]
MSKTLVIAEKPSVAQDIVRALTPVAGKFDKHEDHFESESFVVTSAVGHLVEIQAPEQYDVKRGKWSFAHLPVIPPHFDLKPVDKTKSRLNAVVKQAKRKDVTALVNACDAGREGELIFRLIEQYAGGAKPLGKPVKRLWLQSMTPQAIRDGFERLRSEAQMQGLADAARSRSEADWLVGINGTRAMTAFNSRDGGFFLTTVGRVQTPTLSVVVEREEQIRKFVSRDYWEVHGLFDAQAGQYAGKYFDPAFKKAAAPLLPNGEPDPEQRADRVWNARDAQAIADAARGQPATVTEESKPTTQASGLLFDLTSLQREANSRFGFSAKTTLSLAQSLYERHKALTYPRTDSRALPEDYLPVVKDTMKMLANSGMKHLAPFAKQAIDGGYVKPTKRVFDNAKVSDHFAIIPTLQAPSGLSDAEQKLYDFVVRRFLSVFFPSAEFQVTTRISTVETQGRKYAFRSDGKVLVKPGWMAIYGKEAEGEDDEKEGGKRLVPVQSGETVHVASADAKGLRTRPPARYSEATLLGAMEGAGKLIDDEELREAMQEKGLGTPATRAAIIEGLLNEKYMLREGRELIPTAKAFQLMTLLRGLGVEELSKAELTGEWEYKLAQMEKGALSRDAFMREIAQMTEHIVKKAKEYDRDTVPGDYATLSAPCPNCGGVVKENYRRYACTGPKGSGDGACGFSFTKSPAGRTFEIAEAEQLVATKQVGPLEGFRSKAGWPFVAEIRLAFSEDDKNWKLEFDFGDDAKDPAETGEIVDFSGQTSLGPCPKCGAGVFEFGSNYICAHSVPTAEQPQPTCDFKTGKIILQQPVDEAQVKKLLAEGKTDLLDKFVSMRTRRSFKAFLAWNKDEGKVTFEFEPRDSKFPPRKGAAFAAKKAAPAKKAAAAKKAPATKTAAAKTAAKAPRKAATGTGLKPSAALAAVIGDTPVLRTEATKKLWDYIKAKGLQDPQDKRSIKADAALQAVFGKPSATMFELAGILGKHLAA